MSLIELGVNGFVEIPERVKSCSPKIMLITDGLSEKQQFKQKLLFNFDPEQIFKNIIQSATYNRANNPELSNTRNAREALISEFDYYVEAVKAFHFDKILNIDLDFYLKQYKRIYDGYRRIIKIDLAKQGDKDFYGASCFCWTIYQSLDEQDYISPDCKILAAEFEFIAYHITKYVWDAPDIIHSNYFLGNKKTGRKGLAPDYKKYTGRKINKNKLNYIIKILTQYDIIVEIKQGVKGLTHLRNLYKVGQNNPKHRIMSRKAEENSVE